MKFYSITYDLRQPGRNYNDLYDAIKTLAGPGNWKHPLESFWVISLSNYSDYTSNSIFDLLEPFIDKNDSIIINKIDLTEYQGWMPQNFWTWINEQKRKL